MSELTNICGNHVTIRWKLLASVSAAALLASAYAAGAADGGQPSLWIELGGQFSTLSNKQEDFAPAFVSSLSQYGVASPLRVESPPHYGLDTYGQLLFEPENTNWVFAASIRYGRSQRAKNSHQQTPNAKIPAHLTKYGHGINISGCTECLKYPTSHVKFADASAEQSERHAILDFQAGKDVGLGLFNLGGSSILSAGVRFAQIASKTHDKMHMEPDLRYPSAPITSIPEFRAFQKYPIRFHDEAAQLDSSRSFHGLGPSLSWNASVPVAGNSGGGEMMLEWGVTGAALFGRQRTHGRHETAVKSYYKKNFGGFNTAGGHYKSIFVKAFHTISIAYHTQPPVDFSRTRSIVVPNLGGSIGLSYRIEDFKVSLGYRADFFFGAIDAGIDARKSENRGFFGPFASFSVGIP